jgi:hypothetical protein
MEYHNNFLPGDMVGIKDDGFIEVPEGYFYSGMILREKAPIHTFTYYVMLYPRNTSTDNHIKIIEVPEQHLTLNRFINREHYENGYVIKDSLVHTLNDLEKQFMEYDDPETFKEFVLSTIQKRIELLTYTYFKTMSRNSGKSYLSSTYGEVLNNGEIK